jgi:TP901 family phage tail tape measure protein
MSTDKLVILGEFNDQISPALKNVESGVIRLVGSVSAALTALAAIAAPVTLTASFQKEMLNVKKTTDFSSEAIRTLGKDIVDLSKTINVSADDLAKIAALGGQLGVGNLGGASGLLAFTEEIARAVTALDVNAEEAATSLGKLINIFDIPPEKYRNVIAAINELSNVSTAKPEELFDIMRRIGNLGGSVKVDQSAALSATMIDLGLTAETAGTSLTKVFADMKADAASFASLMGISTSQWSQIVQDDGIAALKMYLAKLNELPPAVAAATKQQMTGGGRIFELITKLQADSQTLGGGVLNQRLKTGEEEFKTGTSAMREQQTVLSGLSAQWVILSNTLKGAAIEAGNASLGPLTESVRKLSVALDSDAFSSALAGGLSYVADGIAYVVDAMSGLTSSGLDWQLILGAGTAAAAAGILSVLTAAIGLLTASLAKSVGSAGGFIATLGGITTAVTKANAAMSKTGQGLFTTTFVNRADGAMRLATQEQAAWDTSRRQLESQLGAYKNFMTRRAEAYRQQRIAPLENIQASGGTLTTQQTRQLNGYRLHYAQLNRLSQLSMNDLVENEQNLVRMQRIVQDRGFAAELEAYRRQRQNRNAANLDLQDSLTDLQGNLDLNASGRGAQGFSGMLAGVREFLTQNQQAFAVAQTGASATERAMVSLRNTLSTVSTATVNIRNAMLALTGDTARFAAAQSGVARAAIVTSSVVSTAYRAMGVAIRGATIAASGFSAAVGKVFMVLAVIQMVAALADMLGVLDKIKSVISGVMKSLGIKTPDFLKPTAELEAQAAAVQKTADEYERLAANAEAFQKKFGTIAVGVAVDEKGKDLFTKSVDAAFDAVEQSLAARKKQITFSFEDPQASGRAFTDIADTLNGITAQQDAQAAATKRAADEWIRLNGEANKARAAVREAINDNKDAGQIADAEYLAEMAEKEAEAAKKLAESKAAIVLSTRAQAQLQEGINTMLSALNADQASSLFFESVTQDGKTAIDRARELQRVMDGVQATLKKDFKGNITIDSGKVTGAEQLSAEDLRRVQLLQDAYASAKAEVVAIAEGVSKIPGLTETLGGKEATLKMLQTLTKGTVDWRAEMEKAVKSAGGLDKAAKGLGTFVVPVNLTKTAIASSIRVALEYRNALSQMVATAEAAAKDAANAMNRAMERHKQDVRDLAAFTNNLTRSLNAQNQKAGAQVATRALEDSTRSRLDGLSTAKALENDILNTIQEEGRVNLNDIRERLRGLEAARTYGKEQLTTLLATGQITQAVYNQETRALDDNVSKQRDILNYYYERGSMTREEAKAVQSVLDIKYRAANTRVNDAADLERSKIAIDGIRSSYDSLRTQAEAYKTQLTAINKLIADDTTPVAERASLLERRNEVAAALRTTLGSLRQETEKFASVDPVAGKVAINEDEVRRMEEFITQMTTVQGQLDMQSAGYDKGIYERVATDLQTQMTAYDQIAKSNLKAADAIKMPREEIERLVAAAGKIPEVVAQLKTLSTAMGEAASGDYGAFPRITLKPEALVQSIQQSLSAIPSSALDVEVGVVGKMSADTLNTMKSQLSSYFAASAQEAATTLNAAGGITIKGKIDITEVNVPGGNTGNVTVQGGAITRATGGPVYGAGTATSDSIPAWLSHGEFVMDARTTRMFSPSFFAKLQEMARRGVNLSSIRTSVRGFANGGQVLGAGQYMATSLNSISESSTTETVAVDLSLNGNKRTRLRGSRDQVDAFAQALREVQKGIAK